MIPQSGGNATGTCAWAEHLDGVSCGVWVSGVFHEQCGELMQKKVFGVAKGSTWESMASL